MTLTLVGGGDIDRHAEERPELRVVEMRSQLFGPPQVCAWFGLDGAEEQRPERERSRVTRCEFLQIWAKSANGEVTAYLKHK